jgi:hypothetical protein
MTRTEDGGAGGGLSPMQSHGRLSEPIILSDEDAASVFTIAIVAMLGVGVCVGWLMHAIYLAVTA